MKNVIKTTGFYSTLWIVSASCKVMAWVILLSLYILHVHEKHAEKHELLYTYILEVQIHLRGTATLIVIATPTRYSVQLHLRSKATPTRTGTFKSTLKNICRRLLIIFNFLFNNENRLMLIKRWGLIIRQNHSHATLAASETNPLILL